MKIQIDLEKCIGCGLCASMCADVFELGDDGKSRVKSEGEDIKCSGCDLYDVSNSCPEGAITTYE